RSTVPRSTPPETRLGSTCSTAGGRPSAGGAAMLSFCLIRLLLSLDAHLRSDRRYEPVNSNTAGRRHNRVPPAARGGSGCDLPWRLPVRHDRHQGLVSGGL